MKKPISDLRFNKWIYKMIELISSLFKIQYNTTDNNNGEIMND